MGTTKYTTYTNECSGIQKEIKGILNKVLQDDSVTRLLSPQQPCGLENRKVTVLDEYLNLLYQCVCIYILSLN